LLLIAVPALLTFGEWAQIVGLGVLLVGIVAIGRVRQKDGVISDLEKAVGAQDSLLEVKERELEGTCRRADRAESELRECEKRIAALQAEVNTLERYTAQGALEQVGKELASLQAAVVSAVQGQGDLVLETHSILREISDTIGANRKAIEKMLARLDA
jgi:chromosome segregation ATPase